MRFPWLLMLALALALFAIGALISCESDDDDDDDDAGDDDDDDDDEFDPPEISEGFTYIPCGTFLMGSPADEVGRRENEQQHQVTFSHDFEMQQRETTQAQYNAVMGFNPSFYPDLGNDWKALPVEQVSWFDALAFANRMSEAYGYPVCYNLSNIVCGDESAGDSVTYCSEQDGIFSADVALNGTETVYGCQGYRLPTEAEWEYAARAGSTEEFTNGPLINAQCTPLDPNLDQVAWYCGNSNKRTHAVGQKAANAFGLFDVLGNVLEWTWDWYANQYAAEDLDPVGVDSGYFKVIRGGSVRFAAPVRCRLAYRAAHSTDYQSRRVGIRLVRSLATSHPDFQCTVPDEKFIAPPPAQQQKQPSELPDELPFEFTRPAAGTPLTEQEIEDFTREYTAALADIDYFGYSLWHTHGMDASNSEGYPDYRLWWQDTAAIKSGDTVTFEHRGGADNLTINTGKLFNNAAAGCLLSNDEQMCLLTEQLCKGYSALFMGFEFTDQDPEPTLMPRAIFTQDHEYTFDGKKLAVTYGPAENYKIDWNARTFPNDYNPYWGQIWIRSMRSKDDVPHIYRVVPLLMYLVQDAQDEDVRAAAADALERLQGFAKDIVDSGYYIRSKNETGNEYLQLNLTDNMVVDLASFVTYEGLDPNAECDPKLASALIGYGEPLDIFCGDGIGEMYEMIATRGHYYNYEIIRYFHIAAATNALVNGQDDVAFLLLQGLARRADAYMDGEGNWENSNSWEPDLAQFLLASATAGLPLTDEEARFVQGYYLRAAQQYVTWPRYDFYSLPDGEYGYIPDGSDAQGRIVDFSEFAYMLEYCYSPFRNPTSAEIVDCDVIADPSQWGL